MRFLVLPVVFLMVALLAGAQEKQAPAAPQQAAQEQNAQSIPQFTKPQLEQLVAPVALYPDNLLAQVLAASTYPVDLAAAARWVKKNPSLSQSDMKAELKSKKWDPSVQGLVFFPDLLAKMNDNLDWTKDLGDAFMEQQKDVLDTIQVMRAKAKEAGTLKSDANQKVTTTQDGQIQIESVNPEVVYVNNYIPSESYGDWNSGISYDYPNVIVAPSWPGGYYGGSWALAYRCAWGNGYIANSNNNYFAYQGNYNANNLANGQWAHNQAAAANPASSTGQTKQSDTGNTTITDIQGIETGAPSKSAAAAAVARKNQNLDRSPAATQAKENAFATTQSNGDLERAYSDRGYTSRSNSTSATNRAANSVSRPAASRPNAVGGAARSSGGGGRR